MHLNFNKNLLKQLRFGNDIKITKGVNIINKPKLNIKRGYKKKYLFVGRLSLEKNIELLVDLFNELQDHSLTIIGSGPLENKLKSKAGKNINIIGNVPNQCLKEYYENNDLLILPSISEPWGLVVEEALYFGIPSIVSNKCGVSELIKHGSNGYIVNPEDSHNLKELYLA